MKKRQGEAVERLEKFFMHMLRRKRMIELRLYGQEKNCLKLIDMLLKGISLIFIYLHIFSFIFPFLQCPTFHFPNCLSKPPFLPPKGIPINRFIDGKMVPQYLRIFKSAEAVARKYRAQYILYTSTTQVVKVILRDSTHAYTQIHVHTSTYKHIFMHLFFISSNRVLFFQIYFYTIWIIRIYNLT